MRKIIPESYQQGLAKENLQPMDMPEIHSVNFKDGILSFVAKVELRPEVKLPHYKGIKVKRQPAHVTDEELTKTLEFIQKGRGEDNPVALDDTFARSLGYPTLAEFKESLKRQMEMEKDQHNRQDVERQIVEHLLKHAQLSVPQSFVKKHLEQRIHEAVHRLEHQKKSKEDIQKAEQELRQKLPEVVEHDVKIYLILQAIAEKEQVTAASNENVPGKVIEFLMKEAVWEDVKEKPIIHVP